MQGGERGVGKRGRDSKENYQKVVGIVVFKGKQKFRLREGVREGSGYQIG